MLRLRDLLDWTRGHGALAAVGVGGTGAYGGELVRVLRIARRSAVTARTQAMDQIRGLLVSAPAPLCGQVAWLGGAASGEWGGAKGCR